MSPSIILFIMFAVVIGLAYCVEAVLHQTWPLR